MEQPIKTLPLVNPTVSHDGGCGCGAPSDNTGGSGCGCGHGSTGHTEPAYVAGRHDRGTHVVHLEEKAMTTHTYSVTGMTCGHCIHAVTSELKALDGVSDVDVDLVAGGTSTVRVTSSQPLDDASVAAALDEAGDYQLA